MLPFSIQKHKGYKMACFLKTWNLAIEISSLYDGLRTGYLGFKNNLSNASASIAIFPNTDPVALALWASIESLLFIIVYLLFTICVLY